MLIGSFFKHRLQFRFPAGTSRGVLREKDTWFIVLRDTSDPERFGIGECGPLAGLSPDPIERIDSEISIVLDKINRMTLSQNESKIYDWVQSNVPETFPSLRSATETALLDLKNGGKRQIFNNGFFNGQVSVPINGLIWMNDKDKMIEQAREKISMGFECIKMKIGAINFEEELQVLEYIRGNATRKLQLRVDANGAFDTDSIEAKLKDLAKFDLHSIEQPIRQGHWKEMREIGKVSPIPIALDEELISMADRKEELLQTILPPYIVLKPTLLGGFRETEEWIRLAEKNGVGWWITSMLESNIGLNAITQFAASKAPRTIHGLGTGSLYFNNIDSPLAIQNGRISYILDKKWDYKFFPEGI